MEKIEIIETTSELIKHHFWCDECGKYIGNTEELDDGYYETPGEYEVNFYLNGWYKLEKTMCSACCKSFSDRIRNSLFEIGFKKG